MNFYLGVADRKVSHLQQLPPGRWCSAIACWPGDSYKSSRCTGYSSMPPSHTAARRLCALPALLPQGLWIQAGLSSLRGAGSLSQSLRSLCSVWHEQGSNKEGKMQGGVRTSLEPHGLSTATLQTTGHSFPSTKFYGMGKNNKISLISQQGLCLGAVTSCLHCLGPERLSSRSKPRAVQKWLWFSWWSQEHHAKEESSSAPFCYAVGQPYRTARLKLTLPSLLHDQQLSCEVSPLLLC